MAANTFNKKTMPAPQGNLPVLQYLKPEQLEVDPSYQREVKSRTAQTLINSIAMHWNWDLAQVLVVSRRDDKYHVIDGQHRLMAAKKRGDIQSLPCVIGQFDTVADEAKTYTALNENRRPMSALDKFRAAIASGDEECGAINEMLAKHGFEIPDSHLWKTWTKPTEIGCVGGLGIIYRTKGVDVLNWSLRVFAETWPTEMKRYMGQLIRPIAHHAHGIGKNLADAETLDQLSDALERKTMDEWHRSALRYQVDHENMGFQAACIAMLQAAMWGPPSKDSEKPSPSFQPISDNAFDAVQSGAKEHCDQCDQLRTPAQVASCSSNWCTLKKMKEITS